MLWYNVFWKPIGIWIIETPLRNISPVFNIKHKSQYKKVAPASMQLFWARRPKAIDVTGIRDTQGRILRQYVGGGLTVERKLCFHLCN